MNTLIGSKPDDLPASGLLPHIGLLRFGGPDAASFLQGQLSNDTRRLADGKPLLAAYSSPQGRVVAVLHLLPHSSGIIALVPREIILPTVERLRKYVLRAKVQIEDISDRFAVVGTHVSEADTALGYLESDGIGVARVSTDANRRWAIGSIEAFEKHRDANDVIDDTDVAQRGDRERRLEQDWRLADIRCGLPQIYAATREMFVAQMLNLDLIDGISFTKGCFTGQEIIARTQHLGRIKRRLFRLRLPAGTWAIGQAIRLMDGRSGRLTELAQAGTVFEALAVLNIEPSTDAESTSTLIDAAELPLPYSAG